MKKLCLLFFTLLFNSLTAQNVPQSINYQSVIRSSNGAVIPNQPIEIKLSILQGSLLGTYVYQEVHSSVTSNIGLVNVKLGEGISSLSSFDLIDWSQEPFFLKVEIDTSLSGSFISIGESEISSVPFSLYSQRSAFTDSLSPLAISKLPQVSLSGDTLIIGKNDSILMSSYTLTETEVDSLVANNGFVVSNHSIGDFYQGGIIFHIWRDSTGEHGLIAAPEIIDTVVWSNIDSLACGATSSWNGMLNTQLITSQTGHNLSAAQSCINYNGAGYTDWYLPSLEERYLIVQNFYEINKSLSYHSYPEIQLNQHSQDWLWHSTELNDNKVYPIKLAPFWNPNWMKNNEALVLPIRQF